MSEPKQEVPTQPQQINIQIPQVSLNDVEGFSKVWRKGGPAGTIIVLLDESTKEFARDFANIVLRSFIIDQVNKATQQRARQQVPNTVLKQTSSEGTCTPVPRPGSIILTD